ncbi:MAG: VWA domain-containing protein [Eubacteriales bacterium]
MDGVEYGELSERYLKALKEDECQQVFDFLSGLKGVDAQLVIDTGKQFHKSSAVNGTWFWRTAPVLARKLNQPELITWLEEGAWVCRGSWECALSFLKASPEVAELVDNKTFLDWVRIGCTLVRFGNHDANWYFKNSWSSLKILDRPGQQLLTSQILKLLDRSWKTAMACMKVWPEVIRSLEKNEQELVLELGLKLAADVPDDADAFFPAVSPFLKTAGSGFLNQWVNASYLIKNGRRGLISAFFRSTPGLVGKTGLEELAVKLNRWALWGDRLALSDSKVAEEFFDKTPQVLKNLDWGDIEQWVALIEMVGREFSIQGALEFVKTTSELLPQLDIKETAEWVRCGLNTAKDDKRLAYFTLKSQESRDAMSRLRTGLHLESVKKILLLYCEGLTGESVIIRNTSELPGRIHGDDKMFGTLDTRRIYLPDVIKEYDEDRDNLRLYRVMMMHLTAHRQFGSLSLSREELKELAVNKSLGLLFEYIEDNRVDYLAAKNYPGLNRDIRILLEGEAVKDERAAKAGAVFAFLRHYLWPDLADSDDLVADETQAAVYAFWRKVVETGASAGESLLLARRLEELAAGEGSDKHVFNSNFKYRGSLCYDLIYTALKLDLELDESRDRDTGGGQANSTELPDSDFYRLLSKLLLKFIEDEENPYRMVAYYDEWDRTLNDYKKDWCRVREILLKPSTGRIVTRTMEEHHGMINTLKRYFGMLRPDRFRRYGRQEDGEDIDIDAVIEAMVEKEAGVSPAGGFYIRRDKRERDVAVGFLLDLSYSTEEVVPGTGKSLLEVETESVIVMSEALEVLGDQYAIYGFNSDSRDKINFYVVKDFEETYTGEVKQRFGGLQSYGMTRLAAAVRHAIYKLEKIRAAVKILILLSDGRPFDFDYNSGLSKEHEEYYAEADTRVALREAKMKGINPFCITVDNKTRDYLEYIYGNVSYIIIDDVNSLPTKLTEIYKNLTT